MFNTWPTVRSLAYYCASLRNRATRQHCLSAAFGWAWARERALLRSGARRRLQKWIAEWVAVGALDFGFGMRMGLRVALSAPSMLPLLSPSPSPLPSSMSYLLSMMTVALLLRRRLLFVVCGYWALWCSHLHTHICICTNGSLLLLRLRRRLRVCVVLCLLYETVGNRFVVCFPHVGRMAGLWCDPMDCWNVLLLVVVVFVVSAAAAAGCCWWLLLLLWLPLVWGALTRAIMSHAWLMMMTATTTTTKTTTKL